MKTKMKSAFAFIAVALMIMVAVVPMVGVFTEDSSAATTIVPADETKNITVEGTVYDSETQKIKDVLVKVSYGTYAEYGLTGNDGKYKIPVNFKGESVDLTVDIVKDSTDYKKYSGLETNPVDGKFTDTTTQEVKGVTGNVTGIDFMSGYVTISGKLTYANTTVAYDKEVSISVKTVVAEGETPVVVGTSTSKTDGTYSVLVPIDSGKVKVSAEGFKETGELIVAKAYITTGTNLTNKDTYKISVTYGNVFGDNTLSTPVPTYDSKVTVVAFEKVDKKNEYTLTYTVGTEEGKTTTDVTFSDKKGYMWDEKKSLSGSAIALAENAYVTGAVKIGSLAILGTDAVTVDTVKFFKSETDTEKTGEFKLTGDGKYVIALGKIEGLKDSAANKVKFTATVAANSEVKKAMDVAISLTSASTDKNIAMPTDGYYLISGVVKNGTANVSGLDIAVTSSNAIGLVELKVTTGTDGKYAFYAKSGEEVTITPVAENDAVFSPSSYKFNAIASKTLNFEMDSKELVSGAAVTDAAGVALKGVTVKYRVGETGTFSDATFSDVNSKFTINVGSNVSADDVYVYFEKTGYTFAATSAKPAKMSDESFKAKEQTLTFEVKDAAGKDITNISGLVLQFAKYKIHAVGAGVNAFDMIGTYSDVTYDASTKKFSFVAESIPASAEDYRLAYGISVKTAIADYTFATITEYAENLVIKANEYTLTGFVKDAAGDKAVSGATVKSLENITGVSTNGKGYFSILVNASEDKITVASGSGYTFEKVKVAGEKEITIKANEKTFTGTIKDADGKAVTGAGYTITVENDSGAVVGTSTTTAENKGEFTIITAIKEGYKLKATDSAGTRTFADITLKGTETTLDVVSEQATYSGKVYLADGTTALKDVVIEVWKTSMTEDDEKVVTNPTEIKTGANGSYSVLLSVADDKAYVVKATLAGYVFSTTGVAFKDYVADIKSTTKITDTGVTTNTIELKDAANVKLGAGYVVKAYYMTGSGATAKYDLIGTFTTDKNGVFKCLYKGANYVFNVTSPSGSVYTFKEYDDATSVINAKESTKAGTLVSQNNVAIPDATISFLDNDGKVLTTAKTDADGKWTATLIVGDVKKITANTSKYGAITLDQATITDIFRISEYIYSGLYANGETISGVVVVFEMKNGSTFIQMGKAAIVDDKYYVVADNEFATGYTMTVSATANNFNAYGTYAADAVAMNLNVGKKPGVVSIATDDVFFGEFYTVYNATNAQVGDKIILRASEVAYKPLEDGNETTVVKYKFNGWYVNGVKVSDDLEYVYTVTEDCLVYADYKASTYETASDDNGISPSVLVIGIAAVIVALIAVVYTVIQKKE